MILSDIYHSKLRSMIRLTLGELTGGVALGGRPVHVVVRFVVGSPPWYLGPDEAARFEDAIGVEAERHGDLARVNVTEGKVNSGKSWYAFQWAVQNFPQADLVFKQDDDTIVNWPDALPRMTSFFGRGRARRRGGGGGHGGPTEEGEQGAPAAAAAPPPPPPPPLRRLYMGRLCQRRTGAAAAPGAGAAAGAGGFLCWPDDYLEGTGVKHVESCGAGSLYGFSSDIVRWVVASTRPSSGNFTTAPEDLVACGWARRFEAAIGPIDRRGLLGKADFEGAWVHPVKDKATYLKCWQDRLLGCNVTGDLVNQVLHFKLRGRTAAGK